ncbi:hypothetical protein [Cognatiluteimonas profundi]|uniref:hypothetical protein n=1 Tax=Cognatiluteimonas profundi TaxID=2594501 RepID=UPI00131AC9FA|nr:hypothetical protein [Lysobacter profundi]
MIAAQVFIDLDSARRFKRPPWDVEREHSISFKTRVAFVVDLFTEMQMKITAAMVGLRPADRVTVRNSRLYHGWHRGTTPTDDRRIWEEASRHFRPYTTSRASFLPDISFGNDLICGGARSPIFDTLRNYSGVDRQKLVDTALVADLLCFTRTESASFEKRIKTASLGLVVADDDDLLPGLFTAEQWGLPIYMLRVTRLDENKHVNVKGLVARL